MRVSDAGVDFITREEGFRLKPYRDSVGLWTVGVGHLLTEQELKSNVLNYPDFGLGNKPWRELDKNDVVNLLRYDLTRFENVVNELGSMAQHEFDALVCFAFNIGETAFRKSTLAKHLKLGVKDVETQLLRWVKPPELLGRRKREIALFNSGKY